MQLTSARFPAVQHAGVPSDGFVTSGSHGRDLMLASTQQSIELKLALDQEQLKSKKLEESMKKLDDEMRKTDELLYQMIPKEVANRLRKGTNPVDTCEVSKHSALETSLEVRAGQLFYTSFFRATVCGEGSEASHPDFFSTAMDSHFYLYALSSFATANCRD